MCRHRWAEAWGGKNMQHPVNEPHFGSRPVNNNWWFPGRQHHWQRVSNFGGLPLEEEPVSKSYWWICQQCLVQEVVCPQERPLSLLLQKPRCKCIFLHHHPCESISCMSGLPLLPRSGHWRLNLAGPLLHEWWYNPIVLSAITIGKCHVLQLLSFQQDPY